MTQLGCSGSTLSWWTASTVLCEPESRDQGPAFPGGGPRERCGHNLYAESAPRCLSQQSPRLPHQGACPPPMEGTYPWMGIMDGTKGACFPWVSGVLGCGLAYTGSQDPENRSAETHNSGCCLSCWYLQGAQDLSMVGPRPQLSPIRGHSWGQLPGMCLPAVLAGSWLYHLGSDSVLWLHARCCLSPKKPSRQSWVSSF